MDELRKFWYEIGLLQKKEHVTDERLAYVLKISRSTLIRHRNNVMLTTGSDIAKASRFFGKNLNELI